MHKVPKVPEDSILATRARALQGIYRPVDLYVPHAGMTCMYRDNIEKSPPSFGAFEPTSLPHYAVSEQHRG